MPDARVHGPEILAPAGSPECLPAAVAGGANAVYLGLRHFNARGRAENFRQDALGDHVAYLHHHGLRCYVVLNTLLHDDEHPKALGLAAAALEAGVDAAIVQDLGLWTVLARELPELERHASTQMTVHGPEQIAVLAELGAARVILARELALDEVAACTDAGRALGVETEHFVHGALCYAFSGQCLISNFGGCRSANRGTCAQNCRFDYADEAGVVDTTLSMKDLSLLGRVGELATAGVASLKIEGRLKGPDYVYLISRLYREAVEAWRSGRQLDLAAATEAMRGVFARGFTDQPLAGRYDEGGRLHRHRPETDLVPDAELRHLDRRQGRAELAAERRPEPGQGFRFSVGMAEDGFLVTGSEALAPGRWRCRVRVDRRGPWAPVGTPLFRNADHRWREEAAVAMRAVPLAAVRRREAIDLVVRGCVGSPIVVEARASDGRAVTLHGRLALQPAEQRPLDQAQLAAKLGAFGEEPYRLGECRCELDGALFLPAAELKRLRRELVAALAAVVPERAPRVWSAPAMASPRARNTGLWVAVADLAAADAAHAAGATAVWLEGPVPADLGDRPWLHLRHGALSPTDASRLVPGHGVVAGHLGTIRAARERGLTVTADHHLNTYGLRTLEALAALGVSAAVLSLECSCREVARVAARMGSRDDLPRLALTVHGRLPAMLTRQEHGLAPGERRRIQAVARDGGLPYQLERRSDGVTVLWEGRRLCAPDAVARTAGVVDAWVLELGDRAPATVAAIIDCYRRLLAAPDDPAPVVAELTSYESEGIFSGHLHQGARELDRVGAGRGDELA